MNNRNFRSSRYKKPNPSLKPNQIDDDLDFLMQEAMKKNIEMDPDIFITNNKRKKQRKKRKIIKEPEIDEEEMKEIRGICDKLSINLQNKQLVVKLYGYKEHIDVYKDIFYWIDGCDKKKRNKLINDLKTNKLRDIQVKLASSGTIGVKLEMQSGIKHTLNILQSKYKM